MSGYNQQSNPFHQYDTRYKPELPQRTNGNTKPITYVSNVSYGMNSNTVGTNTNSGPLYFINGNNVSGQQWWSSFKK